MSAAAEISFHGREFPALRETGQIECDRIVGLGDVPSGSISSIKPSVPAYTSVDGMDRYEKKIGRARTRFAEE